MHISSLPDKVSMKLCHWEIICYEMELHELCHLRLLKDEAVKDGDYEKAAQLRDTFELRRAHLQKILTDADSKTLDNNIVSLELELLSKKRERLNADTAETVRMSNKRKSNNVRTGSVFITPT